MADRNTRYYRSAYIDGNVVRQPERVPERRPAPRRYKSGEQLRREAESRRAAKRNQQAAMSMNMGYVVFLTIATIICFGACVMLIHMQSEVTNNMQLIADLETQISDQKADNAAAEKRLETEMNLSEVKDAAADMGLDYPDSDQIQYYTVESSDYMNQYGEIASN